MPVYVLLVAILMLTSVKAGAVEPLVLLPESLNGQYLSKQVLVLEDPSGELTFEEIRQRTDAFHPILDGRMVKGLSYSAWWIRFDVQNRSAANVEWLLDAVYPHTDYVDLYRVRDGQILSVLTGDKRPVSSRAVSAESFVFSFNVPPDTTDQIYLRFQYEDAGLINLLVSVWSPEAYAQHVQGSYLLIGAFIGAAFITLLFNAIVRVSTHNPAFVWYGFYLICTAFVFIANTGIGYRYLWSDSAYLTDSLHILLGAMTYILALQFNRVFLDTHRLMPKTDWALKGMISCCVLVILCYLLQFRAQAILLLFLISYGLVLMPLVGVRAWLVHQQSSARWYVLAWSVWSVSFFVIVGFLFGVLPVNDIVHWITRLGFFAEAVLLGLALIDQVNALRREKRIAEKRLLKALENTNNELEKKVQERTEALEKAWHDADKMAHTDSLTDIGNRRFFFSLGQKMLRQAQLHQRPLALVIADIDRFKEVNDSRGHAVGDLVIVHLAKQIQDCLGAHDVLGRIGGEEFAFLLYDTRLQGAQELAESLRQSVASSSVIPPQGDPIHYSVSLGLALLKSSDAGLEDLLRRSDQALYLAKQSGRNCVALSPANYDQSANSVP